MVKMLYVLIAIGFVFIVTGIYLGSWVINLEGVTLALLLGILVLVIRFRARRAGDVKGLSTRQTRRR